MVDLTTKMGDSVAAAAYRAKLEEVQAAAKPAEERNAKERKLIDDRHRGGETAR